MKFQYGFTYKNVRYGWLKKELYRLPFENMKRTYGLKKITPIRSGKVYNLQRIQKTIAHLKLMTKKVDWEVKIIENKDIPF
jgi:hypothetical protein